MRRADGIAGIAIAAALGAGVACTAGPVDVAGIAPASVANGMVAHWTFDETAGATAHDSSGNGRDGTIFGPGWSWTGGHFDGALQLSGDDQVTVGGGFGFPQATANYTVAAWLYVASTDVNPQIATVLSNEIPWGVGPPGGWSLVIETPSAGPGPILEAAYRFTYWPGQGPDDSIDALCACVVLDAWIHLAAVIDAAAGSLTFYVGGKARQQVPIERGIWPAPGPLYMGRWPSQGRVLTGMLDDVSIFSRALVPEEVALLAIAPAPNPM
jgi:hypothetical protein